MPQPQTIQALEGKKLVIGGRVYKVEHDEKPPNVPDSNFFPEPKWRGGGEGWVWPLQSVTDGKWILKALMSPCPERWQRIRFLTSLHLYDSPLRIFEACPRQAVSGRLKLLFDEVNRGIEALDIQGYLARFIEGKTFEQLLNDTDEWNPPWEDRQRLAVQLCCGVRALEAAGIAHTDLASQNVMIIQEAHRPPELRIIDFDGVFHSSLPPIPVTEEGGRKFGSDGYAHVSYANHDEETIIRTDRVAMAVLAYELMVLRSLDMAELQRPTLFEQLHLNEGEIEIPVRIENRWPEGADLVRRALSAADPEVPPDQGGPPAPEEWLLALRNARPSPSLPGIPSRRRVHDLAPQPAMSYMALCHVTNTETGESWEVELADVGSFKGVHIWLAWLTYERVSEASVQLRGQLPQEYRNEVRVEYFVSVSRDFHRSGKLDEQYDDSCEVTVTDGDHVEVGAFNLDFTIEATDDNRQ